MSSFPVGLSLPQPWVLLGLQAPDVNFLPVECAKSLITKTSFASTQSCVLCPGGQNCCTGSAVRQGWFSSSRLHSVSWHCEANSWRGSLQTGSGWFLCPETKVCGVLSSRVLLSPIAVAAACIIIWEPLGFPRKQYEWRWPAPDSVIF